MKTFLIFSVLSMLIVIISWRTLFNIKSHGFYRFFAWLGMAWIFANNYKYWFVNPFNLEQTLSWGLLIYASYFAISGLLFMIKIGKPSKNRDDKHLFGFEKTTELITSGAFKYIRHPIYASLIFLNWAIYLKHQTIELFIISLMTSYFLYLTSKFDEKECIKYFGKKYQDYMIKTKMFIPFIF